MPGSSKTTLLDKFIFGFVVIFAASLTNSIFINQIGYYGALILLLYKYFYKKENSFRKTELEYYFLFFLAAELLSAVFSVDPSHAFNNFLKRLLLIPVVYVITAVAINPRRVSKIFYVFLYFSLLSSMLYLWNSYSFFLRGLFQLTGSGPFLFHYPITTSELFSFTALLLFAFVIQKNMTFRKRIMYSGAFLITVLSLLATFKRTGWIGFAAGVIIIIILKREYIYFVPILLLIAAVALTQKTLSVVELFSLSKGEKITEFETKGQINDIEYFSGRILLADYDEGLAYLQEGKIEYVTSFESPVVSVKQWRDNYYAAQLIDTRFVLLGENNNGDLVELQTFMSKGMTKDYEVYKGALVVLDVDSGLTFFYNPDNLNDLYEIPNIYGYKKLIVSGNKLYLFSKAKGVREILLNERQVIGNRQIFPGATSLLFADLYDDKLFIQTRDSVYLIASNGNRAVFPNKVREIIELFIGENNNRYAVCLGGKTYELLYDGSNIAFNEKFNFGYNPKSVLVKGDSLYAAHLKTSRIASIFDPYLPANANRVALWRAGIKMFLDYPVFGVGDIDLAELYKKYKRPFDKEIQGHLHNNYFHFLAILGAFGFIVVMLLLVRIFLLFLKAIKRFKPNTFEHTLALGFMGVYVAFLVAGLTEWNFGDHEIITFIWFSVGMTLSLRKLELKN